MKIALLFALVCSSFSFAAQIVCRNENNLASKETLFVLSGQSLIAVCQRSTSPGSPKLSNEEVCVDDMYTLQGSSSGSLGATSTFTSHKANVSFTFSTDTKGLKTATVSETYEAMTYKGGNKVSVPKGLMFLNCK